MISEQLKKALKEGKELVKSNEDLYENANSYVMKNNPKIAKRLIEQGALSRIFNYKSVHNYNPKELISLLGKPHFKFNDFYSSWCLKLDNGLLFLLSEKEQGTAVEMTGTDEDTLQQAVSFYNELLNLISE